jgi:hypothetical protein
MRKAAKIILVFFIVVGLVYIAQYLIRFCLLKKEIWSISIYTGTYPYSFSPHPFVADPFMVQHNNTWYKFFEVLNESSQQGDIGLATSHDGIVWRY